MSVEVISSDIWDYELIASVRRYLTYDGVGNAVHLQLNYNEDSFKDPTTRLFYHRLDAARSGANADSQWNYSAGNSHTDPTQCIGVHLKKIVTNTCSYNLMVTN